jgi:type II secretory pathway pseudopilin PulG
MEIINIIAILLSPVIAIQVQRFLDKRKQSIERRSQIFEILMATRGARLSVQHIDALNSIDIEFSGKKFSNVINAWKNYFDALCISESTDSVIQKRNDLYSQLLFELAKSTGYKNFTLSEINRNYYYPQGLVDNDTDSFAIRQGLKAIMKGEKPIKVKIEE